MLTAVTCYSPLQLSSFHLSFPSTSLFLPASAEGTRPGLVFPRFFFFRRGTDRVARVPSSRREGEKRKEDRPGARDQALSGIGAGDWASEKERRKKTWTGTADSHYRRPRFARRSTWGPGKKSAFHALVSGKPTSGGVWHYANGFPENPWPFLVHPLRLPWPVKPHERRR